MSTGFDRLLCKNSSIPNQAFQISDSNQIKLKNYAEINLPEMTPSFVDSLKATHATAGRSPHHLYNSFFQFATKDVGQQTIARFTTGSGLSPSIVKPWVSKVYNSTWALVIDKTEKV